MNNDIYKRIFESSYNCELFFNINGQLIYASSNLEKITGYNLNELKNVNLVIKKLIYLEDRIKVNEYIKHKVKEDDEVFFIDFRIYTKYCKLRWFRSCFHKLYDENKKLLGIRSTNIDVTDLKKKEEKLEKTNANINAILNNSKHAFILLDKNCKIQKFNAMAFKIVRLISNKNIKINKCIFKYITSEYESKMKIIINNALDGKSCKMENKLKIKNKKDYWYCININPVQTKNGETIGILLGMIDISDRKNKENVLIEREELYRKSFEDAVVGNIHISLDGTILRFNKAFKNMLGYYKEELLKKNIKDITYSEDVENTMLLIEKAKQGTLKNFKVERRYVKKNKDIVYCQLSGSLICNKYGEGVYFIVQSEDITERKKVEEQLKKLKKSIESSFASVVITDKEGNIEYVNPSFCRITGYSSEEVLGKSPRILKPKEKKSEKFKELWETITSGKVWYGEFNNVKKSGEYYWESASISPLTDDKGKITHFVAVKEDITIQKQYKQELIRFNKRYENIAKNIPGMLYQAKVDLDNKLSFIYVSPACKKIFGVELKDVIENADAIKYKIHPQDRKNYVEQIDYSFKNFLPWHWIGRVVVEGNIKWIRGDGIPEKQQDGSIIWDGIIIDITNQKNIEEEVKKLNKKLKKLSFIDSLTGVYNRRKVLELCENNLKKCINTKKNFSLCMMDLDNFKKVNDNYGHAAGDALLKEISSICIENIRDIDIFGRLGGEEFIIIMPDTDKEQAVNIIESLRLKISKKIIKYEQHTINITSSFGITCLEQGKEQTVQSLLGLADKALYKAKHNGRNKVETI